MREPQDILENEKRKVHLGLQALQVGAGGGAFLALGGLSKVQLEIPYKKFQQGQT